MTHSRLPGKPLYVIPYTLRTITTRSRHVAISNMVTELKFKPKYTLEEELRDALIEDGVIKVKNEK